MLFIVEGSDYRLREAAKVFTLRKECVAITKSLVRNEVSKCEAWVTDIEDLDLFIDFCCVHAHVVVDMHAEHGPTLFLVDSEDDEEEDTAIRLNDPTMRMPWDGTRLN